MVKLRSKQPESFPPLLHLTYDLQQMADRILLSASGVGLGQVRIMSGLHRSASYSQRQLALRLHQTEANVSRQLRLMQKNGLVTITKNRKDSRRRDVRLTAKGEKTYKMAIKLLEKQQKEFLEWVGHKERKAFENVSAQLISKLGIHETTKRKNLG